MTRKEIGCIYVENWNSFDAGSYKLWIFFASLCIEAIVGNKYRCFVY